MPVVFHNGSTYDYHFIIKELVKEFDGNFECLGENTEKYITFSVPIKKKIENKDMEITYKIKFIDSFRFMAPSLSNFVDNLTEDIHGDKCIDCKSDLSYLKIIDKTLIFRCFNCKRNYKKEINKELIERFASTYKFCNNDLNKFVMLLRKSVYLYEYMDGWDKFNETSIPNKESFYSNLTMENLLKRIIYMLITYLKRLNLIIWVIIMIYTFKVTHCYFQMSLRILEKLVLKRMN